MAIPVWPAELPQISLRSGYNRQLPDQCRRSQPTQGPPLVTRKSVLKMPIIAWSGNFTTAQKDLLETFAYDTLAGGSLRFSLPAQVGAGSWECMLQPVSDGMLYQETPLSKKDWWSITLTLQVLP